MSIDFLRKVKDGLYNYFIEVEESSYWTLPDVSSLPEDVNTDTIKENTTHGPVDPLKIKEVLQQYGIQATLKGFHIGPSVTTYEIELPTGSKISSLMRSRDDLSRDLQAPSLRIIRTISDSKSIGFEIENNHRSIVSFRDLFMLNHEELKLPVILGADTYNRQHYIDLTDMPHLLIAGATGSGKSVFINTMIMSLICKKTPEELRLILIDPKQVEFAAYEDLPHLYEVDGVRQKIASEPEESRKLLEVVVKEMDKRFHLLKEVHAKKIDDYNKRVDTPLPYIVFIIDEFADLMLMCSSSNRKETENYIIRLTQKARAVGIHLVLATQKPLAKVMTTLIKANMPARISFSVSSSGDSRVILDENGAETLTGCGDMLYRDPLAKNEYTRIKRIQAPWISEEHTEQLLSEGSLK
jgi:DNA segregation ATPase FtsK/SpoIIIE, S-DNA-T family